MLSLGPLSAGPTSSSPLPVAAFREYPYLIQQGVKLKVEVRVRITGPITGGGAMVRGRRGGSDYFDEAPLTLVSGSSDVYLKTDYEANEDIGSGTASETTPLTAQASPSSFMNAVQFPVQKVFENHRFLRYIGAVPEPPHDPPYPWVYYDPSYGVQYFGATEDAAKVHFQTEALVGYGNAGTMIVNQLRLTFTEVSSALVIDFGPPTD